MIKIAVVGAMGRMGKTVIESTEGFRDIGITSLIEMKGSNYIGKTYNGIEIKEKLDKDIDVVIDFSYPDSTILHLQEAINIGCAYCIGTTGFSDSELDTIKEASQSIPIMLSGNFSLGINLLIKLAKMASEILGDGFDIEIIEKHHRNKKDAPSGTAKMILNAIKEIRNGINTIYGREGHTGIRSDKEIGIFALRGGDIVGEHTVNFWGIGERIELTHIATSRKTFALGAIKAAIWLTKQKAGFYRFDDYIAGK